jgi:hypothetical protein
MSAEIVNLRAARKRAQRRKKDEKTVERRVTHGTPKALRRETEAQRDRAARHLDGHRRNPNDE